VFARNYGRVVKNLDCAEVRSVLLTDNDHLNVTGY